ncbi:MAG: Sua5 family C-terminal domain-containing protein, partial [bacterium]
RERGMKTGVLCTDETAACYRADSVKSTGKREDEGAVGRALFRLLREFDTEEVQVMFSESFEGAAAGQAVMNRLMKAAGHRMVHV